jgi:hypothetical protein
VTHFFRDALGMPEDGLSNVTPGSREFSACWGCCSFNDLVGTGEDRWRNGEAERFGSVEIDDQLEGRRLLHRQIGWLGPGENLADNIPTS